MPYTNEEIASMERLLNTAQEWVAVAKKNHADVDKALGCFPDAEQLTCSKDGQAHGENQMGLRFYAEDDGKESSLIIDLMDQSSRYKRATIYLGKNEIVILRRNLAQLESALANARETEKKRPLFKSPSRETHHP